MFVQLCFYSGLINKGAGTMRSMKENFALYSLLTVDITLFKVIKDDCMPHKLPGLCSHHAVPRDYNPLISQATQCPPDSLMNQYFLVTYLYYVPDIILNYNHCERCIYSRES